MSETKFLNLDEIAAPQRSVTINGVEHVVLDMTVGVFIGATQAQERLKDASEAEQFKATVEMISSYIPTLPTAEIEKLSFAKLNVLLSFINGTYDQTVTEGGDSATGEEKKE